MEKVCVFVLFLILCFSFVFAAEPSTGFEEGEVEDMQEAIDNYIPIDDGDKVDLTRYKPFKSRAEERIKKINEYVGPITNVLWGVELKFFNEEDGEFSWVFIFALVMWILLIELIFIPVSEIFEFNFWGSLAFSGIVATLAMQGFGKDFVIWVESLMTQWWVGIIVFVGAIIAGFVYSMAMRTLGGNLKVAKEKDAKAKTKRHRKIIEASAEVERRRLESN